MTTTRPNQSAAANPDAIGTFRLRVPGDLRRGAALHRRSPAAVAELGSLGSLTR